SLPADLTKSAPKVPWRSITGMRNVLIHEYFGVDLDMVWKVVTQRLPILKRQVSVLLAKSKRSKKKA
ncbi:MAG: HepT-like ribonuclease domain-containing protein, partial [Nitrospiraceae bacterium]